MSRDLPDLLDGFPGGAERLTPQQRATIALFMACGILADAVGDKTLAEVLANELSRWGDAEGLEP